MDGWCIEGIDAGMKEKKKERSHEINKEESKLKQIKK